MRAVDLIVIHCAATPNGAPLFSGSPGAPNFRTPLNHLDDMHATRVPPFSRDPAWRARQNPSLRAIGYHFVVFVDGTVATGRHLDEVGAHVVGNNKRSVGICMLGTDRFTEAAWAGLAGCVSGLLAQDRYPGARVCGHRDLSPDQDNDGIVEPWEWLKICPGFDVAAWLAGGMKPHPRAVL